MKRNVILVLSLLAATLLTGCSKSELAGKISLVFEVEAENLREGESVYITGNRPELGDWQPGAVIMTQISSNLWILDVSVPYGARLEYKFTLGSWEREAIHESGSNMENFRLSAVHSKTVHHRLTRWKAEGVASKFVTGDVRYHLNVPGENIAPRNVAVWLPPGYDESDERYPVLYMHDGQNVFDPYTSFIGIDWGVDEALTDLVQAGECDPVIVVAAYNTLDRSEEYGISQRGHDYQKFMVYSLKPMIDAEYRTRPGRTDTAVMGSSMGGLASFLLAWNYPEVFSQAACLSPAFFTNAVAMVREADFLPDGMRIYMDNGTSGELEQELLTMCEDMMDALADKGYTEDHPDFEWFLDEGAEHNERAWNARIDRPLLFMFGRDDTAAAAP